MSGAPQRAPGDLIDTFRVLGPRPRVGLGSCFDAVETGSGRRVVLKILPGAPARAAVTERLARLGRFSHPGAVPVVAWGLDGPDPWIALDPPSLPPLSQWVAEHTAPQAILRGTEVRRLLEATSQVVLAAHREVPPMVHGGLNPESVLVEANAGSVRGVRLLDFGLGSIAPAVWRELPPSWDPRRPHTATEDFPGDVFGLAVLGLALLGAASPQRLSVPWRELAQGSESALRAALAANIEDLSPSLTQALVSALQRPESFGDLHGARQALLGAVWTSREPTPFAQRALPRPPTGVAALPARFSPAIDGPADLSSATLPAGEPRDAFDDAATVALGTRAPAVPVVSQPPPGSDLFARESPSSPPPPRVSVPERRVSVPPSCPPVEVAEVLAPTPRVTEAPSLPPVAPPLPGPSWSAFSSRDRSEATLPPPKREPIALVDPRTGIFDRFFLQAMVVGVLVLALLVVLLTAR